jgi:hypothetical protein
MLQVRDRLRDVRLRRTELARGLSHASGLHDNHEDMHVLQFDSTADAIAHPHEEPHMKRYMPRSESNIIRVCGDQLPSFGVDEISRDPHVALSGSRQAETTTSLGTMGQWFRERASQLFGIENRR